MTSKSPTAPSRLADWWVRLLILVGLVATAFYFSWWFGAGLILQPGFALLLICAAAYFWAQLLSSWFLYLLPERRREPPARDSSTTVDVYLPVFREDPALVEQTLRSALAMRGQESVYLLDDGDEPEIRELAERHGASYLSRSVNKDHKAGNINNALGQTDGEIIVIFDIDHAPEPEFLERTVGYFDDPRVGFVQVMLTFSNSDETWVARAAEDNSYDFFNPISAGMDRLGYSTHHGSNGVFRRKTLESIGGYQTGLAEDLATSIRTHAEGWQSVYVREPLAPGLLPTNLRAWFLQQLKWSRGVFEVLLTQYPKLLLKLNPLQHLCYGLRMTYYLIGPVVATHMAATAAVLVYGQDLVTVDYREYLTVAVPLMLINLAVRRAALAARRPPAAHPIWLWRGAFLTYATWPIYTLSFVLTVLRAPIRWVVTPKGLEAGRMRRRYLAPQIAALGLLAATSTYAFLLGGRAHLAILISIALLQSLPHLYLLYRVQSDHRRHTVAT